MIHIVSSHHLKEGKKSNNQFMCTNIIHDMPFCKEKRRHYMTSREKMIGMLIKQARLERGMAVRDLAKKLGVDYQYVSRWEKGLHQPSSKYVPLLSKALGLNINRLDIGLLDMSPTSTSELQEGGKENNPAVREALLRNALREERKILFSLIASKMDEVCDYMKESVRENITKQLTEHPTMARLEKFLNENMAYRDEVLEGLKIIHEK